MGRAGCRSREGETGGQGHEQGEEAVEVGGGVGRGRGAGEGEVETRRRDGGARESERGEGGCRGRWRARSKGRGDRGRRARGRRWRRWERLTGGKRTSSTSYVVAMTTPQLSGLQTISGCHRILMVDNSSRMTRDLMTGK